MTKISKKESESAIYFLENASYRITKARFGAKVLRQVEETLYQIELAKNELDYLVKHIEGLKK